MAHKLGLQGPRGVSTPLYHRLIVKINQICEVRFYSCTCLVEYYLNSDALYSLLLHLA